MAAALNQCDVEAGLRDYLRESAEVVASASACAADIARALDRLMACAVADGDGRILLCGNGGSAADAQHLAAELVGQMGASRRPIDAVALTADTAFLTAWANDVGFADVFARQVQSMGRRGDVLLALSTSGTSENVIRALTEARRREMTTILLTGMTAPTTLADITIRVPSSDTQRIQEAHIAIGHFLCQRLGQAVAA